LQFASGGRGSFYDAESVAIQCILTPRGKIKHFRSWMAINASYASDFRNGLHVRFDQVKYCIRYLLSHTYTKMQDGPVNICADNSKGSQDQINAVSCAEIALHFIRSDE
jgi:hypothetical protein